MKSIASMDTVQIEVTNKCIRSCSNCTRFCGHFEKPYFIPLDSFEEALESLTNYPQMVGLMGGEPLLHPEFAKFCALARKKFPREQLGLWSAFPKGKEAYREIIVDTFGNIFLNDHTRPDIYHHPLLVAADELVQDPWEMYFLVDRCWIQNSWSAAINPNGAFFCEVAASWSLLLGETLETSKGWKVKPGWWWGTPKDFKEQIEQYCHRCGGAMPLHRRPSVDGIDDISPNNLELLKANSPKLRAGQYKVHDLGACRFNDMEQMAMYKDQNFRDAIAARYNIFLSTNSHGFNEPFLSKAGVPKGRKTLYEIYREKYPA